MKEATSDAPRKPPLEVDNLVKTFVDSGNRKGEPITAVDSISFGVPAGTLLTLLGPSGCGKTTTMRCIAGLERPDSGVVRVDGRTMYSGVDNVNVSPQMRGLGMVFQSYAIWPHMNVFQNAAFPIEVTRRRRHLNRSEIRDRVMDVLGRVQLDEMAGRPATDLSGGQQQRLALARALIMEPSVLLLDEPLSNLDAKLREEMRLELKQLQRRLGITAIYVTHDQAEALAMSKYVAVMNEGRIEQIGRPREIYERPATEFVAGFIGTSNFLTGDIVSREPGGAYVVASPVGRLFASSSVDLPVGSSVTVAIRQEQISIEKGHAPERVGVWNGVVEARAYLGEALDHVVNVRDATIRTRTDSSISIPPGSDVTLTIAEHGATMLAMDP
jgi:iron(III) transport system ATP-binding protein